MARWRPYEAHGFHTLVVIVTAWSALLAKTLFRNMWLLLASVLLNGWLLISKSPKERTDYWFRVNERQLYRSIFLNNGVLPDGLARGIPWPGRNKDKGE